MEERGAFREAAALLAQVLTADPVRLDSTQTSTLAFELERLRRIRLDYPLARTDLFRQLQRSLPDLAVTEFERWVADGRFDARMIDDTLRFFRASVSNLFWRYPELNSRRPSHSNDSSLERSVLQGARSIAAAASRTAKPFVLPKQFNVRMSVTVDQNATPPGDTIRAWLPVPRRYPHQQNLNILSTSSPVRNLAPESSPIRSLYMEQVAVYDQPTLFSMEYRYTAYGVRFPLEPRRVKVLPPGNPVVRAYTGEAPHIVFTEPIKALSHRLVGAATNPLIVARAIYNWVTDSIRYSYAPEFSTIRNLSELCLLNRYGDCGEEALLFITLCRYNDIPARWQSGWLTLPDELTIHDWAEIYLEPYGWLPVDPYMGLWAKQYATGLSTEDREFVRDFYFGGLDQYRIAVNSEHCQQLAPVKRSMRSDNVDFQRGEVEFGSTNIYFDQFNYDLIPKEIAATE